MATKGTGNEKETKKSQTTKQTKKSQPRQKEAAAEAGNKKKIKAKGKSNRCKEWEKPEKLILLQGWASDGLSMEQIAHNMGISKQTLYNWIDISIDIFDSIKKGKEVIDFEVQNALCEAALNGNVVAQIFWLKNRCPDKWKDKIEQQVEGEVEHTGGVIMMAPRLEDDDE